MAGGQVDDEGYPYKPGRCYNQMDIPHELEDLDMQGMIDQKKIPRGDHVMSSGKSSSHGLKADIAAGLKINASSVTRLFQNGTLKAPHSK